MKTTLVSVRSFPAAAVVRWLVVGWLAVVGAAAQAQQTVLWSENFDDAAVNSRWIVDNGVWEMGVPTSGPPVGVGGNRAHSGSNCAATVLAGNYLYKTDSRIMRLSSFTVPAAATSPRLRFWHWFSNSNFYGADKGYVEVKEIGTTLWNKVSPDYINSSGAWTYGSVDLSAYAGKTIQIAFHFVDDPDFNSNGVPFVSSGWYVDDVSLVYGAPLFNNPEGFESGWGDWSAENGVWEVGKPTSGPNAAKSGLNCLATILDGDYPYRTDSRAISPSFVVPAASSNPRLRFWHWFSNRSFYGADNGFVEVKETGATTWVKISPLYKLSSGVWTYAFLDLSAFGGKTIQIAFHFVDDPDFNSNGVPFVSSGWYVDDILIESDAPVQGAPSIVYQLESRTVDVGQIVVFSAVATGNSLLTYQWRKDGTNIAGATTSTLSLTNVQIADAASYSVAVANSIATVNSNAANLTVAVRPANDNFSGAQIVSGAGGSIAGSNVNATTETTEPSGSVTGVWFSWTAPDTARWQFSTIGSAFDTQLWVYSGSTLAALTSIGTDDDTGGSGTSLLNFDAISGTVYRIRIGGKSGLSGTIKLNWSQLPGITTQPESLTFVIGETATFAVVANGVPAPTFQWRKDGLPITGATSSTLSLGNVQTASIGNYSVVLTNSAGTLTSDNARLDVVPSIIRPSITRQPTAQIVVAGNNVTFTVAAGGTAPFNFGWLENGEVLNDDGRISGTKTSTLTIRLVQAADNSAYSAIVTNAGAGGTATSTAAPLTVVAPPSVFNITRQPQFQIVTVGGTATFSVAADGSAPLTYKWKKDNVAIPGATNATLTLSNVQAGADGRYLVEITNSAGTVTSNTAPLTVIVRPANDTFASPQTLSGGSGSITGTNANATTETGEPDSPATSVWFTWTAPAAGRWQFNTVGSVLDTVLRVYTGTALNALVKIGEDDNAGGGVTSLLNFTATANLTYRIRIDGKGGASDSYTLTWSQVPEITTQPVGLQVVVGQSATLTVVATGDPAPSYQWRVVNAQGTIVNIPGQIGDTFSLPNIQLASGGTYSVVVSNRAGNVTSSSAAIAVIASATKPTVTTQPQSQVVTAGNDVTFSVAASGTSPFTYVWLKNGAAIVGATSASLVLRSVQPTDNGGYTCVVTNAGGTATSNAATLTVATATAAIVITAQPQDQAIAIGGSAAFSVGATGVAALSYQWRKDGNPVAGETRATLSLSGVQAINAGLYSVVVSSTAGSITSSAATLAIRTVAVAPVINNQLRDQTVGVGATVAFDVSVTGTAPFSYQWRRNGAAIPGATLDQLIMPNVTTANAGSYTVLVTNLPAGSATSNAATLTINTTPTITTQPADQSVALRTNVALSVTASGTGPLSYQWSKDGRVIAGANYFILALSNVTNNDGGTYAVAITNGVGNTTSRTATLVVSEAVSKIVNVSVRSAAGIGPETLIVGFGVTGQGGTKPVLVRGVGPTLGVFGVTGFLVDPVLSLFASGEIRIAGNDNWSSSPDLTKIVQATAASGAFALMENGKDAVVYAELQPGGYSAQVTGIGGTGLALTELYDTNRDLGTRLNNVSARTVVGQGDNVLIAGFVIAGNTPKRVLVRAIGPTLAAFGVTGTLSDPQLVLKSGSVVIATNNDWWREDGEALLKPIFPAVGAFTLVAGTKDAALVATLPPGAYTATVLGADGGTGVALVEVYELP